MSERVFDIQDAANAMSMLSMELGKDMVGNELQRELTVGSLVVGQHILYEGEPGTGKTQLAKRLAAATGLSYGRVQGVADTVPADIIGYEMPNMYSEEKTLHFGPIHKDVVFIDEMNRMSDKAQSALNSAMAEGLVTIGNTEYPLNGGSPFFVIATQNEHGHGQGTFPVSDALYDRFGMVVPFNEFTVEEQRQIIDKQVEGHAAKDTVIEQVIDDKRIMEIAHLIGKIKVNEAERDAIAQLADIVRNEAGEDVRVMGGARLSQTVVNLSRARALQAARSYVTSEDVLDVTPLVMGHRIELGTDSIPERQQVVREALENHVS